MPYHEVAPQLVLMAYLQRVVNGGGYNRPGVRRRTRSHRPPRPLAVSTPGGAREWQREAIEIKVWRQGKRNPRDEGLRQLDAYLERLGLAGGYLVIFDRRSADVAPRRSDDEEADVVAAAHLEATRTPQGRESKVLILL